MSAGLLAAVALTLAGLTPASAGDIFDLFFGGFHRSAEPAAGLPTDIRAFADPFEGMRNAPVRRAESAPTTGYCVRTSDGFYFPVQPHAGVRAADVCHAFCPGSRLYSGGGIDNAVAADGSRYADLDTAFFYRKQLVDGATCNGRDHFGLTRIDIATDPTLRRGDVVATKTGLVAVTTVKNKVADFAPLTGDRAVPRSTREKLAGVKIMPPNPGAPNVTPVRLAPTGYAHADENRRAQLAR
ncbi:MAG: DUF2865 domain-containing protein [Pseudolabrys sp.]